MFINFFFVSSSISNWVVLYFSTGIKIIFFSCFLSIYRLSCAFCIVENSSSLKSFGVNYAQIELLNNDFDYDAIKDYLTNQEKVKTLQQFIGTLKNNSKIVYVEQSFDPKNIQKVLKEQAKNNPALMGTQKSAKD